MQQVKRLRIVATCMKCKGWVRWPLDSIATPEFAQSVAVEYSARCKCKKATL